MLMTITSASKALLLGFIFAACVLAQQTTETPDCSKFTTCDGCSKGSSWMPGTHCRWCNMDGQCHAYASPDNPCSDDDTCGPPVEQIHLALADGISTGTTGMRVGWFTWQEAPSMVQYGTATRKLTVNATGKSNQYLELYGYHHVVELRSLTKGTKYFYRVGDDTKGWSEEYSFRTSPADNQEFSVSVFGDMGWLDSTQRPMVITTDGLQRHWSASYTRTQLATLQAAGSFDWVWHLGDIGYGDDGFAHSPVKFSYEGAYNGFMNWMQNISAYIPYMVSVGNHESECHDPDCFLSSKGKKLSNFTAYNARWHMPSSESGGVGAMWYSFDYGSVHFISVNSETDYPGAGEEHSGDSGHWPAGKFRGDGEYLRWLKADLKAAQASRIATGHPRWLVAGGHRPVGELGTASELFTKYGVDMYFAGHVHSYSRGSLVNGTTHIVVGGAGCDEMPIPSSHNATLAPTVAAAVGDWAGPHPEPLIVDTLQPGYLTPGVVEYFTARMASGVLTVNSTGLHWRLVDSKDGAILDRVSIAVPHSLKV